MVNEQWIVACFFSNTVQKPALLVKKKKKKTSQEGQ